MTSSNTQIDRKNETVQKMKKDLSTATKRIADFVRVVNGENHTPNGIYDTYIKLMPVPLPIVGVVSRTIIFKLPLWLSDTSTDESSYTFSISEIVSLKAFKMQDWQQSHNLIEIDKSKLKDGWWCKGKFLVLSAEGEVIGFIVDGEVTREVTSGGPTFNG